MGEWKNIPFADAVTVNPYVPMTRGKVYPFVDMKAIDPGSRNVSESEQREFKSGGARFVPGDTLMARITPCLENGKIARYAPHEVEAGPAFGSTEFIIVRGREGVTDNDYAYYLAKWPEFRDFAVSQMTGSSGRQRVPVGSLSGLDVRVPPLPEQKAIAHILGTLDDKIELNRRMNETLEAIARAIFKSWFVDFDPVRAKAEGRETGLPKEIENLFPDGFEESELGEIPKGWKRGTLADMSELNPETWKPTTAPERITYVDLANTKNGVINSTQDCSFQDAPSRARRVLRSGDTIVGTVRPGNRSFAYVSRYGLTGSTGFAVLRPKSSAAREFVYLAATREDSIDHLAHLADGAAYPAVRPDVVHSLECMVPTSEVLTAFHTAVAPLFAGMGSNMHISHFLVAIRDHLLPQLVAGVLSVSMLSGLEVEQE